MYITRKTRTLPGLSEVSSSKPGLEGKKLDAATNGNADQNTLGVDQKITLGTYTIVQSESIAHVKSRHSLMSVDPCEEFRADLIEFAEDGSGAAGNHHEKGA